MNQHRSRKTDIMHRLNRARDLLKSGFVDAAQAYLALARYWIDTAPASTRRRWKVGL